MAQPKAPTTRGKRVVLTPARAEADKAATYVCTAKPLLFGEFTLTEGVEVPGASSWTRVEAWVSARRIRKLEHGEKFISFQEFTAPAEEIQE